MARVWWLWIPLLFTAIQVLLEVLIPHEVLSRMLSENGPHELLQFFVVAAALFVALLTLAQMDRKAHKWLAAWVGLAAVCCFYVAGEEVSWGQHFLDWTTPEFWSAVNDQQETNLHNTSSWLDQKPRLILEIGVLTAGLIIPLLQKYKPGLVPERFTPIYAPCHLWVIAVLALGLRIAEMGGEAFGVSLFARASEVEELYLFYFVLLYMAAMKKRLTAKGQAS